MTDFRTDAGGARQYLLFQAESAPPLYRRRSSWLQIPRTPASFIPSHVSPFVSSAAPLLWRRLFILIFEQVLLCEHIEVKKRMVGIRKRISKTPTGGRTRNASPALCMPSEGLVSPLNLLELLLCVRIGRVAVRMVLHGKRSVRFPDFFLRCPKRDSQDLVWRQLFAHGRRNIASTFLSLSALEGKLMVFPHSPSVVEYANILVADLF